MAEKKPRAVSRRASAKKVAKKEVKKTKVFPRAKKSVMKSKVEKAKKVTKKTSKKSTKKTSQKKKKSDTKLSLNKISTKKSSNKFLTNKALKNEASDDKSVEAVSLETSHRVAIEDDSVTIFSRVRTENTVMLVARVLGLVFVCVGTLLTLFGLSGTSDTNVITRAITTVNNNFTANVLNSVKLSNVTEKYVDQINYEPSVKIDIPNEAVHGIVEANLIVSAATQVFVRLHNEKSGSVFDLGYAKASDGTLWKQEIDTTKFEDGVYLVSDHVTTSYGAYVEVAVNTLTINNTAVEFSETIASTTDVSKESSDNENDEQVSLINETADSIENETLLDGSQNTALLAESTSVNIEPLSTIAVHSDNPISGFVSVTTKTSDAQAAELYVRQKDSLRDVFIGIAKSTTPHSWDFKWDTTQIPNGEYQIIAKFKNLYGFYWSDSVEVVVRNKVEPVVTESEKQFIDAVLTFSQEKPNPLAQLREELSNEAIIIASSSSDSDTEYVAVLQKYSQEIEYALHTYAQALRTSDITERRTALLRIDELRNSIVLDSVSDDSVLDYDRLKDQIGSKFERLVAEIEDFEKFIKDNYGDTATQDSDFDGLTDYDELTLYKTNPGAADSDLDGYIDYDEVIKGFDPNSDTQESVLVYESPKDTGMVSGDLLTIENIVPEHIGTDAHDVTYSAVVISGTALPNSFANLYVFSEPFMTVVKTNKDGNWNYRLEKPFEDGDHQMYIAQTNNAGTLTIKSSPFEFNKSDSTFTPKHNMMASVANLNIDTPHFSNRTLLAAGGSLVMGIGFILLLLTARLYQNRQKRNLFNQKTL